MEAGQKFYTATAGYSSKPFAFVGEYECVGTVCGLVAYKPPYLERIESVPESETFASQEEARAACISKLHSICDRVIREIEDEIVRLEANR